MRAAFGSDAIALSMSIRSAIPLDRDERQLEVARRLAVVAGKDPQAAGIRRQALVHAELCAEVGHQVLGTEAARVLLELRLRVVRVERPQYPSQRIQERGVRGGVDQALPFGFFRLSGQQCWLSECVGEDA